MDQYERTLQLGELQHNEDSSDFYRGEMLSVFKDGASDATIKSGAEQNFTGC